ncbi:unnamed protein product [Penicillium camemberti]|uniref:Str. FM013 n=1 Tax=Penicillium camemberti (strain FM 013) TaxID=1429867 RepID=A0A0G4NYX4_PENC3|nr:unnamed protein product [Penicillium camemberti]
MRDVEEGTEGQSNLSSTVLESAMILNRSRLPRGRHGEDCR